MRLAQNGKTLRILITGLSGMLGVDLCEILREEHEVVGFDLKEFPSVTFSSPLLRQGDITRIDEVREVFNEVLPQMVIHTAAYTDVDGCEKNPGRAHEINALGTKNVCLASRDLAIPVMYISTDFVFDGKKSTPYLESDEPHPMGAYGRSKLAGEKCVKTLLKQYFVVTILRLAREKKELTVVDDQVFSPTYAKDLARKIGDLVLARSYGVYHITNSGNCSWYEFAEEILGVAGVKGVRVKPITSQELDRPAPRPKFSVLENYHLGQVLGSAMRDWKEALRDYMGR